MSFTNINDPAGIKALLEQLRTSQAWQETVGTTVAPTVSGAPPSTTGAVAALLSQLQTPLNALPVIEPERVPTSPEEPPLSSPSPPPPPPPVPQVPQRSQDVKSLTFQQSLPVLAQPSADPNFVSFIAQAGFLAMSLPQHILKYASASDEGRAGLLGAEALV